MTIRLKEISTDDLSSRPSPLAKKKDWLDLLLREHLGRGIQPSCSFFPAYLILHLLITLTFLVGLKYVTSKQILEVSYESYRRRFAIASTMAKGSSGPHPVDSLSHGIKSLSLDTHSQIWLVSWDTEVLIIESDPKEEVVCKVGCFWDCVLDTIKS